jgi:hypothetical protein
MVRRKGSGGRSLGAIDANLAGLKEQLLALQARIDAADGDRLDVIAKAALDAFPEIDNDEYGDDLEKFLSDMHEDALRYRAMRKPQAGGNSGPQQPHSDSSVSSKADDKD